MEQFILVTLLTMNPVFSYVVLDSSFVKSRPCSQVNMEKVDQYPEDHIRYHELAKSVGFSSLETDGEDTVVRDPYLLINGKKAAFARNEGALSTICAKLNLPFRASQKLTQTINEENNLRAADPKRDQALVQMQETRLVFVAPNDLLPLCGHHNLVLHWAVCEGHSQ